MEWDRLAPRHDVMSLDFTSPDPLELLQATLAAADPSVRLVSPRFLRRVIKRDRGLVGFGHRVPHAACYVIERERLLAVVPREELDVEEVGEPAATVVLLVRPPSDRLTPSGLEELLLEYWRLLFHARVHRVLEERLAEGRLSAAGLRHRIQELGATEFHAARRALEQENRLLPPGDEAAAYVEFAAYYLELVHFEPHLLPLEFAGLEQPGPVQALLALDVDAEALFQATRLAGAPDPRTWAPARHKPVDEGIGSRLRMGLEGEPSEGAYRRRVRQADRSRARGNLVRAAITRMQAAEVAGPKVTRVARTAARAELNGLIDRLTAALGLPAAEEIAWRQTLPLLLPWAARGAWPAEARLLYDLQKVCLDHERDLYAIDLVGWAASLGRKPVKRPLPHQRRVLLLKHLRGAAGRVHGVRLMEGERDRLAGLLDRAVARQEGRLREELRPVLDRCLDEAGLTAGNVPEGVARAKVVEEYLDLVVEHGFVSLGDLRDVVARNQLKLPDLAGPGEWMQGDRLLRADYRLARALDGVHHRGEFYLRALQRLSSLAFGTRLGRVLVLFLILPFGGAYFGLEGLQHIVNPVLQLTRLAVGEGEAVALELVEPGEPEPDEGFSLVAPPGSSAGAAHDVHLATGWAVLGVGLLLFGLIHFPRFRAAAGRGLRTVGKGLQATAALPGRFLELPAVRGLLSSRWMGRVTHYLLKPVMPAVVVGWAAWRRGVGPHLALECAVGAFIAMTLLLSSRLGRRVEAVLLDRLEEEWHRLSFEVMPALIGAILDAFKMVMGALDRLLYTVDEWLRFRGGQGKGTFVAKAVLGTMWAVAAYLVRLTVVLMVEPTLNPVKHFPTVTVAAKLIIPLFPWIMHGASAPLMFLGPVIARTFGSIVFLLIPGLAGFLVWELKENWRLYAANRPLGLRPVVVGPHGESMRRLLRPGLHSGTLPKLFTKLRRAQHRAWQGGGTGQVARYRESLHRLEEGVRRFVEREGCALLNTSTFWADTPVRVGQVVLGANRVAVEVVCPQLGPGGLWISFDERSRWVLAGVQEPAWLGGLGAEQRQALVTVLAGLYKLAGVDVVQEQVRAVLPAGVEAFDMVEEGLTAWAGADYRTEVTYRLTGPGPFVPGATAGDDGEALPVLKAADVLYSRCEVPWAWWVRTWEEDQQGQRHPALPFGPYHILTDGPEGAVGEAAATGRAGVGPVVRQAE